MNYVDWIIVGYALLGACVGFIKGFVAQVLHFAGIVIAIVVTFLLFPRFGGWVSGSLNVPDAYSQPVSLAIIFTLSLLIVRFLMPFVQKILGSIANTNPVNRLGGTALGAAANILVTSIVLGVLTVLPTPASIQSKLTASQFAPPLTAFALGLDKTIGKYGHATGVSLGFQIDKGDEESTPLNFTNPNPTEDIEGEVKMAILINELRDKKKVPILIPDLKLQQVAQAHAKDMLAKGYFGHKSPDGVFAGGRVHQAGITATEVGENLAKSRTVELAQAGLIASPTHLKTMTNAAYNRVGIAVFDSGANGKIVVQLFAKID